MPVTAPTQETAWLLHHVVGFDAIGQADTAVLLEQAGRFAEGGLAVCRTSRDAEVCDRRRRLVRLLPCLDLSYMSNFRLIDRDTGFLLPPSVDEWLPERHLARFVVEVVEGLDLGSMAGSQRGSGEAS